MPCIGLINTRKKWDLNSTINSFFAHFINPIVHINLISETFGTAPINRKTCYKGMDQIRLGRPMWINRRWVAREVPYQYIIGVGSSLKRKRITRKNLYLKWYWVWITLFSEIVKMMIEVKGTVEKSKSADCKCFVRLWNAGFQKAYLSFPKAISWTPSLKSRLSACLCISFQNPNICTLGPTFTKKIKELVTKWGPWLCGYISLSPFFVLSGVWSACEIECLFNN